MAAGHRLLSRVVMLLTGGYLTDGERWRFWISRPGARGHTRCRKYGFSSESETIRGTPNIRDSGNRRLADRSLANGPRGSCPSNRILSDLVTCAFRDGPGCVLSWWRQGCVCRSRT